MNDSSKHLNRPTPQYHLTLLPSCLDTLAAWVPPGRALHIADVENLMGGPLAGAAALRRVRDQYADLARLAEGDHILSACNPRLAVDASRAWFASRWLWRGGKDGAELALLDAVDPDDVARRYNRVVIGSGDHAFTPLAHDLGARGVEVWVVARRRTIARSLGRAADVVALLRPSPQAVASDCAALDDLASAA